MSNTSLTGSVCSPASLIPESFPLSPGCKVASPAFSVSSCQDETKEASFLHCLQPTKSKVFSEYLVSHDSDTLVIFGLFKGLSHCFRTLQEILIGSQVLVQIERNIGTKSVDDFCQMHRLD